MGKKRKWFNDKCRRSIDDWDKARSVMIQPQTLKTIENSLRNLKKLNVQ